MNKFNLPEESVKDKMKFHPFKKEYFDEYKSWFEDEKIKKALYDIDDEWLEFVLSNDTRKEYTVSFEFE